MADTVRLGGLKPLVSLARGELTPEIPQEDETKEKDRRVEYEATRVIARFVENGNIKILNIDSF
jgi:hypothetical protein